MGEVAIRVEGRAGRITLARPEALNALTYGMVTEIDTALRAWRDDAAVALVLIDAEGTRAFCAGGDIAEMYRTGMAGDYDYGRRFWRDEYAMNARIAAYPKPVVSLMQGFVMGGGVGVGCHASHRVVGESARVAMPECGIGLVPDVGGSALLARAPQGLGRYLGLTGARMGPGDAIFAGFADHFLPDEDWPALVEALVATGDAALVVERAAAPPESPLARDAGTIAAAFAPGSLADIVGRVAEAPDPWAEAAGKALARNAPLSMACTLEMLARLGPEASLRAALGQEYRFTHRAMEHGDFLEGIRAAIIEKDNAPRWRHAGPGAVTADEVGAMLAPLGAEELQLAEEMP